MHRVFLSINIKIGISQSLLVLRWWEIAGLNEKVGALIGGFFRAMPHRQLLAKRLQYTWAERSIDPADAIRHLARVRGLSHS